MDAIDVYNEYKERAEFDLTSRRSSNEVILRALRLLAVVEHDASKEELGYVSEQFEEAFELLYATELADA